MLLEPFAVGSEVLALDPMVRWVERQGQAHGEGCGGITTFVGVVRATHQGRRVRYLEYEAHDVLATKTFRRIAEEAAREWPLAVLAIQHRVGRLEIGEASVAIAAGAAHRAEAFQVCRYAIERVKQISPVWKHEYFEDGDAWVEGPVADPDNDTLRREALDRACA